MAITPGSPDFNDAACGNPRNHSAATCSWSNNGAQTNHCSCTPPSPATGSRSYGTPPGQCPSGFTGTYLEVGQTFDSTAGAGHCKWNDSGSPYGCSCNTATQHGTTPHNCAADPNYGAMDCWDYGVGDNTMTTIDPATCNPTTTTDTPLTGTCVPKNFKWVNDTSTGNTYSGSPPANARQLLWFRDTPAPITGRQWAIRLVCKPRFATARTQMTKLFITATASNIDP